MSWHLQSGVGVKTEVAAGRDSWCLAAGSRGRRWGCHRRDPGRSRPRWPSPCHPAKQSRAMTWEAVFVTILYTQPDMDARISDSPLRILFALGTVYLVAFVWRHNSPKYLLFAEAYVQQTVYFCGKYLHFISHLAYISYHICYWNTGQCRVPYHMLSDGCKV